MLSNVFQIISSRTSSYFLRDSFSHEEEALISKSCTFERAAPTAADPKETLSSKRVVGSSENRAVVGAVSSFGLRKCRWGALGIPQSGLEPLVPHPWPETSAICRIPCIPAVQGHGPRPPWEPKTIAPPLLFPKLPSSLFRPSRRTPDLGVGGFSRAAPTCADPRGTIAKKVESLRTTLLRFRAARPPKSSLSALGRERGRTSLSSHEKLHPKAVTGVLTRDSECSLTSQRRLEGSTRDT